MFLKLRGGAELLFPSFKVIWSALSLEVGILIISTYLYTLVFFMVTSTVILHSVVCVGTPLFDLDRIDIFFGHLGLHPDSIKCNLIASLSFQITYYRFYQVLWDACSPAHLSSSEFTHKFTLICERECRKK